jgi:hypothetical protein
MYAQQRVRACVPVLGVCGCVCVRVYASAYFRGVLRLCACRFLCKRALISVDEWTRVQVHARTRMAAGNHV